MSMTGSSETMEAMEGMVRRRSLTDSVLFLCRGRSVSLRCCGNSGLKGRVPRKRAVSLGDPPELTGELADG